MLRALNSPDYFSTPNKFLLGLGKQTLFPLEEDVLAVLLQLVVPEGLGARLVDELAVPGVLALHAVWIIDDGGEVLLNATSTRF